MCWNRADMPSSWGRGKSDLLVNASYLHPIPSCYLSFSTSTIIWITSTLSIIRRRTRWSGVGEHSWMSTRPRPEGPTCKRLQKPCSPRSQVFYYPCHMLVSREANRIFSSEMLATRAICRVWFAVYQPIPQMARSPLAFQHIIAYTIPSVSLQNRSSASPCDM